MVERNRETGELRELAADLREAATSAEDKAHRVVRDSAQAVRRGWRRNLRNRQSSETSIPHLPKAVTYDTRKVGVGSEAVIGYDKDKKQGPLGNLLEFGSVNNPPGNEGGRALRAEEDNFYRGIRDVVWGELW
jgi:hypothetical protein